MPSSVHFSIVGQSPFHKDLDHLRAVEVTYIFSLSLSSLFFVEMFVTFLLWGLFTFPGTSFCGHFSVSSCLPKCHFTLQGQFDCTQNHGFLLSSQPLKKYFTAVTLLTWPLEKYLPQNHGSIRQRVCVRIELRCMG